MDVTWVMQLVVAVVVGSVLGSYIATKYSTWRMKRFIKKLAYDEKTQREVMELVQALITFVKRHKLDEKAKEYIKQLIDEVF